MSSAAVGGVDRTDYQRCLQAFKWTVERWTGAVGVAQHRGFNLATYQFAVVGEALFWAAALDDAVHPPRADPDTQQLLDGLRYARNRVTHSLVRATDKGPGMTFPVTFPMTFHHWVWRDAADIPAPVSGFGKSDVKTRLPAYEVRWQRREVGATLRALDDCLTAAAP